MPEHARQSDARSFSERFSDSADRWHNRRVLTVFAGIALLMLVTMALVLPTRDGSNAHLAEETSEGTQPTQTEVRTEEEGGWEADSFELPAALDADVAERLRTSAREDGNAAFALEHAGDYAALGEEAQLKLLELAADEPQARAFVRNVLSSYPQDLEAVLEGAGEVSLEQGTVPRFYQWDERWAYLSYSNEPFGLSGCCPTSAAMVCSALTGRTDLTPAALAQMAFDGGFVSESDGTYADFLYACAREVGLSCVSVPIDASAVVWYLSSGYLVVCNVGQGDFTDGGHFIVITGVNEDGTYRINDPFSEANSDQGWDTARILGQTIGLYAFGAQ